MARAIEDHRSDIVRYKLYTPGEKGKIRKVGRE
jgi:hypothetical protein